MRKIFRASFLNDVTSVFLMCVLPFFIYLKHSAYTLYAPEILLILGAIIGLAVGCGILLLIGRTPLRIVIFTALAVLIVDVQTDWITTVGLRLLLNIFVFASIGWFLRQHLSRFIAVALSLMVLVTILQPSGQRLTQFGSPAPQPNDNPNLPFVLHLVLDEQIGVEGIPRELDPQGEAATALRDFYLSQSFAVYGRAYSHYGSTAQSIPNLLNWSATSEANHFLNAEFERGLLLENNRWFDLLHKKGYRIHAMESSYMRFVGPTPGKRSHDDDTSLYYVATTIKSLESSTLTRRQRIPFILSTYYSRSWLLSWAASAYTDFVNANPNRPSFLPDWDLTGHYPGALATLEAIDVFTDQLRNAGPGQAFFSHILMPHSPYGFDRNCQIETQPGKWLRNKVFDLGDATNNSETRSERYALYFGQMMCLQSRLESMFQILRDKGLWDDAIVIIHGDHGSRISLWPTVSAFADKLVASDYVDTFSTLFAYKGPHVTPSYRREMVSIDALFGSLVANGIAADDSVLSADPWVYFQDNNYNLSRHSMPRFAFGEPE